MSHLRRRVILLAYPHILYREPGAFQQSRLECAESNMVVEIHQLSDVHHDLFPNMMGILVL